MQEVSEHTLKTQKDTKNLPYLAIKQQLNKLKEKAKTVKAKVFMS